VLPRIDSESRGTGSLFRIVSRTVFKCVFIDMSTPVTVPLTTVPTHRLVSVHERNAGTGGGKGRHTVLQFDGDTFIVQFHEEADELHGWQVLVEKGFGELR
jgi:hypothetical protein